jgi:hypothetical protein
MQAPGQRDGLAGVSSTTSEQHFTLAAFLLHGARSVRCTSVLPDLPLPLLRALAAVTQTVSISGSSSGVKMATISDSAGSARLECTVVLTGSAPPEPDLWLHQRRVHAASASLPGPNLQPENNHQDIVHAPCSCHKG